MRENMNVKRSKDIDEYEGWTQDARDVHQTFARHGKLLLLLYKLDIINDWAFGVLCREFQAKTWSKIRDGE